MIKFVLNTPKGGVGKTTTATNIALLLARNDFRVLAVDLAGGLLMSQALEACPEFSQPGNNRILQIEGQSIPTTFRGSNSFDFAVLDTDDSFTVAEDLLLGTRTGWRVISPVDPYDKVGLERIPREIRAITLTAVLTPSDLKLSIVTNMAHGGNINDGYEKLSDELEKKSIISLLSNIILPHGNSQGLSSIILLDDHAYREALTELLRSVGVVL
ncbi:AAA family ATPase [Pantoea deleyi]|uniref:nucleotide-binding protein n=1 Tax=Pantoea TaxID=53335 RepID=UPI0035D45EF3